MVKAEMVKQLMIAVDNKVGTLAEVSSIVSGAGINMMAVCAYAVDNKGFIMFVSEDNKKALQLLKKKGYDVREEDAVLALIDNRPGALKEVTERIAEAGIDLNLIYGSVDKKGKFSPVVLITEDNDAVLTIIKMIDAI